MSKNSPEMVVFERLKAHLRFYRGGIEGHRITELARYCQVSRGTIYNWLWGKTKPKRTRQMLIKEWLEKTEAGE